MHTIVHSINYIILPGHTIHLRSDAICLHNFAARKHLIWVMMTR